MSKKEMKPEVQEENEGMKDEVQKEPEKTEADLLREENEAQKEQLLRLQAEYDNFRKRTAKEKDDIFSAALNHFVSGILPVLDNLERAVGSDRGDAGEFETGVQMILQQFTEQLKKLGVEEIPALGEVFDPDLHNAINQVEDENFGENTICQVFQKGYRAGDKVLRHSAVIVANP